MAIGPKLTHGNTGDADRLIGRTRVAVFRGLEGIGDFLVAVPALRVLRKSLPQAGIGLIAPDCVRGLALRFGGLFDEFVPFPGWPGLAEGAPGRPRPDGPRAPAFEPRPLPEGTATLDAWRGCEAVVQMHGDGTHSNRFCESLAPRVVVAYGPLDATANGRNDSRPYPRELREAERCFRLAERAVRLLGFTPADDDRGLEFPLTTADCLEAAIVLADAFDPAGSPPRRANYFVLHPGSKRPDNQWPVERFASVGRALSEFGRVLVSGSTAEVVMAEEVAGLVGPRATSVAGRVGLGGLAALIAGSGGVVSNDTGVSHLADAVGTRSVVVFMASDPHRWAPHDESLHGKAVAVAGEGEAGTLTPEGARLTPPPVSSVLDAAISVGMIRQ